MILPTLTFSSLSRHSRHSCTSPICSLVSKLRLGVRAWGRFLPQTTEKGGPAVKTLPLPKSNRPFSFLRWNKVPSTPLVLVKKRTMRNFRFASGDRMVAEVTGKPVMVFQELRVYFQRMNLG